MFPVFSQCGCHKEAFGAFEKAGCWQQAFVAAAILQYSRAEKMEAARRMASKDEMTILKTSDLTNYFHAFLFV